MRSSTLGLALPVMILAAGCSHHHQAGSSAIPGKPLRIVAGSPTGATPTGFGLNGRRMAWVGQRVVVADLDSGRQVDVAPGGGNSPAPVALSGSTVLWLDNSGAQDQVDTLRAASPRAGSRTLAKWFPETIGPIGTFFGGVAGQGTTLAYALYKLSPVGNPDACDERRSCRRRISGGGTYLVRPGSLVARRILPPARALAADRHRVAAAVFRRGSGYTGKAQIVVRNLPNGRVRPIGRPASVLALALDGRQLAALIGPDEGSPTILRVWNIATKAVVRTFRVPEVNRVVVLADSHAVLRLGETIFTLNIRTGRRHVVTRYQPAAMYGPWVSGGRVLWVEGHDLGIPGARSLIRSAPVPGSVG